MPSKSRVSIGAPGPSYPLELELDRQSGLLQLAGLEVGVEIGCDGDGAQGDALLLDDVLQPRRELEDLLLVGLALLRQVEQHEVGLQLDAEGLELLPQLLARGLQGLDLLLVLGARV